MIAQRATVTWTAIEDAVRAAVVVGSGLPEGQVVWKYQNTNQPKDPYIALDMPTTYNPGQDGVLELTDLSRPEGKEIERKVIGIREVILELECFTLVASTSNAAGADARTILEQLKTSMALSAFKECLYKVGGAVLDRSDPVQYIPAVIRAGFRGRATHTVRLTVPAIAAREFTTYIERVQGTIRTTVGGQPQTDTPFDTDDI